MAFQFLRNEFFWLFDKGFLVSTADFVEKFIFLMLPFFDKLLLFFNNHFKRNDMKIIPTLLLGAALAATAHAADSAPSTSQWSLLEEANGKAIYSTEDGQPALVFGCNDAGKISATFSLDGNIKDKLASRSSRTRRVDGALTVGDGDLSASLAILRAYHNNNKVSESPITVSQIVATTLLSSKETVLSLARSSS